MEYFGVEVVAEAEHHRLGVGLAILGEGLLWLRVHVQVLLLVQPQVLKVVELMLQEVRNMGEPAIVEEDVDELSVDQPHDPQPVDEPVADFAVIPEAVRNVVECAVARDE